MKELSIEEKARRYDEAIKRVENIKTGKCETAFMFTEGLFEHIFPELKESEDERIRKEIVGFLDAINKDSLGGRFIADRYGDAIPDDMIPTWIAWLEKQGKHANFFNKIQIGDKVTRNKDGILVNLSQLNRVAKKGEQKTTDKVEPKFHEGDWITCMEVNNVRIISIDGNRYEVEFLSGNRAFPHIDYIDRFFHLWTIQDAKAGDVLATDDWVFIFKELNAYGKPVCYCHYDDELGFKVDVNSYLSTGSEIYPAKKEQRTLLFQKMHEAGYEWDAEKLELKKIEQNPAWSEEDERIYNRICDIVHNAAFTNYDVDEDGKECGEYAKIIGWFKSLKDRYTWRPSGAQIASLTIACDRNDRIGFDLTQLLKDLKKLKVE